ncbi:MAG TPA: type 4a pilus biogenesis protein PilO [Lacunisphaera sp.]|jgi:Tfp pilus assembly protein PilO
MTIPVQHRQRLLFIIAGAGLILLILDRVAFTPLTNLWRERALEITRLETNVAAGNGLLERADQLKRVWADMASRTLPKDPSLSENNLITAFDRCGRTSGIELGSIKPQWKRGTTDRYSVLECRVDGTGSYATLARFLFEVEKLPMALRLESVELTSRDDNGGKLSLGLVITGLRLTPMEGKQ